MMELFVKIVNGLNYFSEKLQSAKKETADLVTFTEEILNPLNASVALN